MGLFFALLGIQSLSVFMWDVQLPKSNANLAGHATWLGHLLCTIGLAGLLACAALTYFVRQEKAGLSKRYVRRCMHILACVQMVLIVELTYTGLWMSIGPDPRHADVDTTLAKQTGNSGPAAAADDVR